MVDIEEFIDKFISLSIDKTTILVEDIKNLWQDI